MDNRKIILLGGKGASTNIVFNFLNKRFDVPLAIIEEKENRIVFLRRRIKKLGTFTVIGQIAFQLLAVKLLDFFSKKRKNEIVKANNLDLTDIPNDKLKLVTSVNLNTTIKIMREVNPGLIIVNGTRIISNEVLNSVPCKFINMHAGITPKYRGVHGIYWALVNNDLKNSGVTVHFVDAGIDTGTIIGQAQVFPTSKDNFVTYPLLQLTLGVKLLENAIVKHFNNCNEIIHRAENSMLWYHPTIWQYVYYRITKKIK